MYGKTFTLGIGSLALAALGAGQATAATTPVSDPIFNEANHIEILEAVYGGTWTQNGNDFSGNGLTATRIDDDNDQTFDIGLTNFSARAVAKYAALQQTFGVYENGSFVELFQATGNGTNVSGSINHYPGGVVEFGRGGGGLEFSSDASKNIAGDHMVTYSIEGLGGTDPVWLLFWEDTLLPSADRDYQDLVVEVSASVIPLPPAALTGIATLLGAGAMGYIRRRTR